MQRFHNPKDREHNVSFRKRKEQLVNRSLSQGNPNHLTSGGANPSTPDFVTHGVTLRSGVFEHFLSFPVLDHSPVAVPVFASVPGSDPPASYLSTAVPSAVDCMERQTETSGTAQSLAGVGTPQEGWEMQEKAVVRR